MRNPLGEIMSEPFYKERVMNLPEWSDISHKVDIMEPLNPMERFVYENLPAGEDEQLFYIQLRNALEYIMESAIKSPNK
jgi:hypothetical protein